MEKKSSIQLVGLASLCGKLKAFEMLIIVLVVGRNQTFSIINIVIFIVHFIRCLSM